MSSVRISIPVQDLALVIKAIEAEAENCRALARSSEACRDLSKNPANWQGMAEQEATNAARLQRIADRVYFAREKVQP